MTETDALLPEPAAPDEGPRFIRSLRLTNLLSFGPAGEEIELRSLNVLVGANGSGKTNFVEALGLLASAVRDISEPIRKGGGVKVWVNQTQKSGSFQIRSYVPGLEATDALRHTFSLGELDQRSWVNSECIRIITNDQSQEEGRVAYSMKDSSVTHRPESGTMLSSTGFAEHRQSVLSQLKDPKQYQEIGHLQTIYGLIRLYRTWSFGPDSPLRKPQMADLPNEWLAEDYGNLFLILNRMEFEPEPKAEYLERLRDFLPDVTDYKLQIVGGTILMFLMEGRNAVPATRLSDGTLRWLCLLAILVAPSPPGVIVLEEPELGLHPDMINTLADMLKRAATRHQLVVTTHSDILIDALSDVPEAVMVVEKEEDGTTIRRLDAEEMKPWLEKYRLGRLWMKGQIGGTRW